MELDGLGVLLGVKSPWVLKKIDVQHPTQVIDVYIEYERGAKFECPNCGELCKVHDGNIKRIRHLDLFDYRCYLGSAEKPKDKFIFNFHKRHSSQERFSFKSLLFSFSSII